MPYKRRVNFQSILTFLVQFNNVTKSRFISISIYLSNDVIILQQHTQLKHAKRNSIHSKKSHDMQWQQNMFNEYTCHMQWRMHGVSKKPDRDRYD